MIPLIVWSTLACMLAAMTVYTLTLIDHPDDPWWLPLAAPYLITWCYLHNTRRREWAGIMA